MDALIYKTFAWPVNPHTYKEVCYREPVYLTANGITDFVSMSEMGRVISGSGAFFGEGALGKFKELMKLFEDGSLGILDHPVWGQRLCYFSRLEMVQEPRDDYVSYSFEFLQAQADGSVPKG